MMSLQRSMHSSQMYTVGPAMSSRPSSWLLPQNEQTRLPPRSSPCLAIRHRSHFLDRPADDHFVHQAVLHRLLSGHEHVPVGILLDLLEGLAGVFDEDVVHLL